METPLDGFVMKKTLILALATFAASQVFAADEYVLNGDFEAGSAHWSQSTLLDPPQNLIGDFSGNVVDSSGDLGPATTTAWLGGYSNADDSITQTIAPITSGATGTLSFDYYDVNEDYPGADFLTVSYGGQTLQTIDLGSFDTVKITKYHVVTDVSSYFNGTAKDLKFEVKTDSSLDSSAFIDNVSLSVVNPTPEPASMAALAIGAGALLRRRRK